MTSAEVDNTWRRIPLKRICRVNERVLSEDTQPAREFRYVDISCVDELGRVYPSELMAFGEAPSRARRLIQAGDVLVSTVRTYLRAIAAAPLPTEELVCSTGFAVLSPNADTHPRFLYWFCRSSSFLDEVVARSVGVSYPAVSPNELGSIPCCIPPRSTQKAIADFLDAETTRIDDLVVSRLSTRALLEERARTVTSATLTGYASLADPDPAELGPSGEFQIVSLGRVATIQTGLTVDEARRAGSEAVTRPYLRVANVQDGYLALENLTEIAVPLALAERCELRPGDVLMTEGGDLDKLGRGTVWPGAVPGCLHQNHVFAVRPQPDLLDPLYLALMTTTHHARAYFESTGTRTTNLASTNASKIAAFPIPLPPLPAQRELVARVQVELEVATKASKVVTEQATLLRERRQALITSAVTGQVDLTRGAA